MHSTLCWNLKQFTTLALLGRPMDCRCGQCIKRPKPALPDVFRCDRCDRVVADCNGTEDEVDSICNTCWAYAHPEEAELVALMLNRILFKSEGGAR